MTIWRASSLHGRSLHVGLVGVSRGRVVVNPSAWRCCHTGLGLGLNASGSVWWRGRPRSSIEGQELVGGGCSDVTQRAFFSSPSRTTRAPAQIPEEELEFRKKALALGYDDAYFQATKKKTVAMLIGYLGTAYQGVQWVGVPPHRGVENFLLDALFKAGRVHPSNAMNINKLGWSRSSRTDKGVHSLFNLISFKMEVKQDEDLSRLSVNEQMVDSINKHLPEDIRVFGIAKTTGSFVSRLRASARTYEYLLPESLFKRPDGVAKFQEAAKLFIGHHWFRSFSVGGVGKKKEKQLQHRASRGTNLSISESELESETDVEDEPAATTANTIQPTSINWHSLSLEERIHYRRSVELETNLHPKSASAVYWREITSIETQPISFDLAGTGAPERFLNIKVSAPSFIYHQLRKVIGTLVAVSNDIIPTSALPLLLSPPFTFFTPLAPAAPLVLTSAVITNKIGESSSAFDSPPMNSRRTRFKEEVFYPRFLKELHQIREDFDQFSRSLDVARIDPEELNRIQELKEEWNRRRPSKSKSRASSKQPVEERERPAVPEPPKEEEEPDTRTEELRALAQSLVIELENEIAKKFVE